MMKTKLLVAAGFAAAGVMLTAAGGWADAQSQPPARGATRPAPRPPEPPKPPRLDNEDRPAAPLLPEPPAPPRPPRAPQPPRFDDETRPLEPPLGRSRFEGPQPIPPGPGEPPPLTRGPQQRVEHLIRAAAGNQDELIKLINDEQANGWEFAGETHVGKVAMLVFKRPKGNPLGERPGRGREPFGPDSRPIPSQEGRFAPTRPAPQPPAPRGDRFPMSSNPSSTQPPMAPGLGDALPPRDLYTPSPINSGPPPMMPMSQPALMPQPTAMIPPARRADVAEISVLELKHAQPAAMSQHVKAFFPDVTVAVDEATGSLVIRCDKPTLDAIKALTEKLDKPAKAGGNFSAVPS